MKWNGMGKNKTKKTREKILRQKIFPAEGKIQNYFKKILFV